MKNKKKPQEKPPFGRHNRNLLIVCLLLLALMYFGLTHSWATGGATVELYFTAPGDDGDVGIATCYEVRYTDGSVAGGWTVVSCESLAPPDTAGTPTTLVVEGLPYNKTLTFQVRTSDEVPNWSLWSNTTTRITDDKEPPSTIMDLF